MTEKYRITRTCDQCNHFREAFISKREAAFELVDYDKLLGTICRQCGSATFSSSRQLPDLDLELMLEWATNANLSLMEQDEELMLAEEKYLPFILELLDNHPILERKQHMLMDALCIMVYDITEFEPPGEKETLKKRVISEINLRKDKLELADEWIMSYIKKVVYPQLGL
ncbi:hypothetical protein [Fluviicola sp.]|uniref:hypothetical protein n=1 Tax=Fluviicola sp. TaxID=1917219 RepID=UPI0031DD96F6